MVWQQLLLNVVSVCVCVHCQLLEVGWFGLINSGLDLSRDNLVPPLANAHHQMGKVAIIKLWRIEKS